MVPAPSNMTLLGSRKRPDRGAYTDLDDEGIMGKDTNYTPIYSKPYSETRGSSGRGRGRGRGRPFVHSLNKLQPAATTYSPPTKIDTPDELLVDPDTVEDPVALCKKLQKKCKELKDQNKVFLNDVTHTNYKVVEWWDALKKVEEGSDEAKKTVVKELKKEYSKLCQKEKSGSFATEYVKLQHRVEALDAKCSELQGLSTKRDELVLDPSKLLGEQVKQSSVSKSVSVGERKKLAQLQREKKKMIAQRQKFKFALGELNLMKSRKAMQLGQAILLPNLIKIRMKQAKLERDEQIMTEAKKEYHEKTIAFVVDKVVFEETTKDVRKIVRKMNLLEEDNEELRQELLKANTVADS